MVAGLAITLGLAGCSGNADETSSAETSSATPSETVTSEAPSETPAAETPTPEPEPTPETLVVVGKSGVIGGQRMTAPSGEYVQLTLAPDSPLRTVDEGVIWSGVLDSFSLEQVTSAQNFVVETLVSEGIDSIMAFDNVTQADTRKQWLETTSVPLTGELRADLQTQAETLDMFGFTVSTGISGDQASMRGNSVDGGLRYSAVDATVREIYLTTEGDLGIRVDMFTAAPVTNPTDESDTTVYTEYQKVSWRVVLLPEGDSWAIAAANRASARAISDGSQSAEEVWATALESNPLSSDSLLLDWVDPRS